MVEAKLVVDSKNMGLAFAGEEFQARVASHCNENSNITINSMDWEIDAIYTDNRVVVRPRQKMSQEVLKELVGNHA